MNKLLAAVLIAGTAAAAGYVAKKVLGGNDSISDYDDDIYDDFADDESIDLEINDGSAEETAEGADETADAEEALAEAAEADAEETEEAAEEEAED